MREQFIENFGKQEKWKGLFLFFVYFIFNLLGENVLTKMGNETLLKNGDFILYLILFLLAVILLGNQERKAIKAAKDKKKLFTDGLTMLVIISVITIMAMVIAAIVISHFGIRNYNQELVEQNYRNHKLGMLVPLLVFAPVSEEYIYRFFSKQSFEIWSVDNCAEIYSANNALSNGASWDEMYINTKYFKNGEWAPPCENCKITFGNVYMPKKGN